MGKTKHVLFTVLSGTALAASFLLGDDAYRTYIRADRDKQDGVHPDGEEAATEQWEQEALDNTKLHAALYVPETETHDYIILLRDVHDAGNSTQPVLSHYQASGRAVLLPDARGTGKSTGSYIGYGYDDRLDVITWIHRILRTDPKAKIALHGMGTGAATALLAGAEHLPGAVYAVIADSSYTTLSEYLSLCMKREENRPVPVVIRLFLLRIMTLARAGFDIRDVSPEKAVEAMNVPTLFVHGDEDKQIPVEMCRTLYRRAGCTRQIGVFLGAGHLQSVTVSPDRYFHQAEAFLKRQHPDRL